jgi:ornithine cyclodeaminase
VETIRRVRSLERIVVCGTSPEKSQQFADWAFSTTGVAAFAASAEEASAADIVAACTTSPTPVVVADKVQAGAHINAVGAFTPSTRELPGELMQTGRIFVDTRAGALSESGDLLLAGVSDVAGEVGDVLLGTVQGRTSDSEITIYKSVGAAFLDAATARLAFDQAGHQAMGTVYEFDAE